MVFESDGFAESNTTLLLAGKRDWGERGEPRNAFHGELLTAGHSADVPIKVEVCEHVCICKILCVSKVWKAATPTNPQELIVITRYV